MTFSSGRLSILAGASTASNVGTYSIQVKLMNELGAVSTFIIKIVISAAPIAATDGSTTTTNDAANPATGDSNDATTQ